MLTQTKPHSVLIVDDDKGILTLEKNCLQNNGYNITTTENGSEAITMAKEKKYDLMLLDYNLADMTAEDIVSSVCDNGRYIPYVIVTGTDDCKLALEMIKSGAADYIVKDSKFLEILPSATFRAIQTAQKESLSKKGFNETSQRQAAELLSNIPVAIFRRSFNYPYSVKFYNNNIEQIAGCALELANYKYNHLVLAEDFSRIEAAVSSAVSSGQYKIEYRIKRPIGTIQWVCEKGRIFCGSDGQALWLDGIIYDITGQKYSEKICGYSSGPTSQPKDFVR